MVCFFNCYLQEDVVSDDIARSDAFIKKLFALGVISSVSTALDGGAGIGRVTKHLLLKHAATVDMLEPSPRFIEASLKYVADERVRHRICATYSDFTPGADRYDIIWLQWSIGYIRDAEFVDVMRRLASSLTPGGAICIKDNVTSGDVFYLDAEDNCFIRPAAAVEAYMGEAGLKVGLGEREERPGLFPVGLWAFTKKE